MQEDAYRVKARQRNVSNSEELEREKWDRYYALLPLNEADDATKSFDAHLVELISELLPNGSNILEAGCGGGWQSLALMQSGRFQTSLMDFSRKALRYAQRIFEREKLSATFILGDVFTAGEPEFDLVFNVGGLEHYTLDKQVAFLRGLASRSSNFVLALVPNRLCYWYWLWRIQKSANQEWPFGKETPIADLSGAFEAAGLRFLGQTFMGSSWTESFISSLLGADSELCKEMLQVHRSPLIPEQQKSYLVAALGTVLPETRKVPRVWMPPSLNEEMQVAEMNAALADALALRIGADQQMNQLQAEMSEKDRSVRTLSAQLAESDQIHKSHLSEVSEQERARQMLSTQIAQQEQTIVALSDQMIKRDELARDMIARSVEHVDTIALLKGEGIEKEQLISSLSSKLLEKERALESLATQLANHEEALEGLSAQLREEQSSLQSTRIEGVEKDKTIEALSTRMAEQLRELQSLMNRVVEKEEALQTLSTGMEEWQSAFEVEREQAIALLRVQLDEQEKKLAGLEALLTDKDQALIGSREYITEIEKTTTALAAQVAERERAIQMLSEQVATQDARLDQISSTIGWRLLSLYGPFKYRHLLPVYRMLGLPVGEWKRSDKQKTVQSLLDQIAKQTQTVQILSTILAEKGQAHEALAAQTSVQRYQFQSSNAYDVICFPIIDWDFRFQRPQQLMSRFASAGHRVFYLAQGFRSSGEPYTIQQKLENIYEVSLRGPDRNIYADLLDDQASDELLNSLDSLRRELSLGATAAFVHLPFWWPLVRKARDRFGWPIVYDCMDHHAGFSTNKPEMVQQEDELLSSADLTVVSSAFLEEQAQQHSSNILLLRNASDYEHFSQAGRAGGQRPVIGYYGAIADWFDGDLVASLAQRRPNWDFVLVGSTFLADTGQLSELPNVALVGEKPYSEIPTWLGKFDVAIIPFKRLTLTEATNPVKAYEILASGKPLVSVPIPEMVSLAPLVRLASTVEEFEAEINAALDESDTELIERRKEFAQKHTWEQRYKTLDTAVRAAFSKASIIVLTFNNLELNRLCLESLYARTEWPNFEVIVVDNGSTDGTVEYLRQAKETFENLHVTFNDSNLGFAAANNIGLKQASGEYLVLLNNDTVLTRGWLSALIKHLHADLEIGIIGPVTNEVGNEAKVQVGYYGLEDMAVWASRFVRENDGSVFSIPMLAMFCLAIRAEVFELVGLLDESFEVGMFEDDDYARRVKEEGYKVVCARDSFIHHAGGASFKLLSEDRYSEIFEKNREIYERKWGKWEPHMDERAKAQKPGLLKQLRRIVKRSGVDAHRIVVFLPSIGWNTPLMQRPQHLARELSRQGFLVFFDCTGSIIDRFAEFLQLEKNLWLYKGPSGVLETLDNPVLWTFPYNASRTNRWSRGRIVYDFIDDLSVFPYKQTELRMNHNRMLETADLVLCVAHTLMDKVEEARPDALYVPNGVDYSLFSSAGTSTSVDLRFRNMIEDGRPVAGYYGAIASWFDVELVAEVAGKRRDWNFVIIGQKLSDAPSLTPLEEMSNVLVLRSQPYEELPAYLARFSVAMIPFKLNQITEATSPIKLYEYFAAAKPVISTPLPECQAFPEALIVRDAQEFSRALDTGLEQSRDSTFRQRLRSLGRDNSWAARVQQIDANLAKEPSTRRAANDQLRSERGPSTPGHSEGDSFSEAIDQAGVIARRFHHLRAPRNEHFFEALATHLSGIAADPCLPMYFEFAISCNERGRQVAKLLQSHTELRGKRFLDVGCAYGGFLVAFAEQGAEVAGIDIDEALLNLAEHNLMDNGLVAPLLARDATRPTDLIEFRDNFDIITCEDVIEHVEDPGALIENIAAMLCIGGIAYVEIPNRYYPRHVLQEGQPQSFGVALLPYAEAKQYYSLRGPGTPYAVKHYLDLEQYKTLFEQAGLHLTVLDEMPDHMSIEAILKDASELRSGAKANLKVMPVALRRRIKELVRLYMQEVESAPRATASERRDFILRYGISSWRIIARKQAKGVLRSDCVEPQTDLQPQSSERFSRFRTMSSHPGKCNVCGNHTSFFYDEAALYRESLTCGECLTTSRYRSIARGLLQAIRELTGVEAESIAELGSAAEKIALRVYDTQVPFCYETNAYPIPDMLSAHKWIDVQTSIYRPGEECGLKIGSNITNQNLEKLAFPDNSFDIVITTDVMEHVRLDDLAHQEIRRVLKAGGIYLFTVPHFRHQRETLVRVEVVDPSDSARDQFLMEKEYHGDANSEGGRALSYRAYGTELDERLSELGFTVVYTRKDFPDLGIMNTELFYCRLSK